MNGLDKFVLSTISMGFLILLITAPAKSVVLQFIPVKPHFLMSCGWSLW